MIVNQMKGTYLLFKDLKIEQCFKCNISSAIMVKITPVKVGGIEINAMELFHGFPLKCIEETKEVELIKETVQITLEGCK